MSVFVVAKNNRGSTIGIALILAVVFSLVSLSIIDILQLGNRTLKQSSSELSMKILIKTLRQGLNDPTLCPLILGQGLNTVNTAINSVSSVSLQYNVKGGSSNTISAGYVYDNKITLDRVELKIKDVSRSFKNGIQVKRAPEGYPGLPYIPVRLAQHPSWPTGWAVPAGYATLNKYSAEIKLIYNMKNSMNFLWNPENEKNKIKVLIKTNAVGTIMSCHGESSEAEACESRGYSFDGLFAPPAHRCNPDFYCRTDRTLGYQNNPTCTPPYRKEDIYFNVLDNKTYSICSWCNPCPSCSP